MKFVDYVTIAVRSGHGGSGSVSFRREKYNPRGGPDGGDGGRGGSIVLRAKEQLYSLLDLRFKRHHFAENGHNGSSSLKTGKDGDDIILNVPPGVVVKDTDTGEILGELMDSDAEFVVAAGGRGGKGNAFFKSATRRTPRFSQPGEPGEERNITIELKLMADVGLVGFPNAGKSTLVSSLSAATPKIADYPFTTLLPSLGVVSVREYQSFVIADIPGIIEGAHEGRGLGIQFLKHIERNAVLLFMISVESMDIGADFRTLMNELEEFNARLLMKPRLVGLSKIDLIPDADRTSFLEDAKRSIGGSEELVVFSSVTRDGLEQLKSILFDRVEAARSFDVPTHN